MLIVECSALRTRKQRRTGRGRDGARETEDDQMPSQLSYPMQIPLN